MIPFLFIFYQNAIYMVMEHKKIFSKQKKYFVNFIPKNRYWNFNATQMHDRAKKGCC
jgi:hypothetical protein